MFTRSFCSMKSILLLSLLSTLVNGLPVKPRVVERAGATYDYIVVGCGAAGLTVSMRLSEDPDISVLCIEAGPFDDYETLIQFPVYIGETPFGFYDWQVYTVPQDQLDGNSREIPMGKGVGGSTLINGMLWNRGFQDDFDAWAGFGNTGWGWSDMMPYFLKSETYTAMDYPSLSVQPVQYHSSEHGTSGPVQVSYPEYYWPQSSNWFAAMSDLGIPIMFDVNEGLAAGACYIPSDIDYKNQTRSDARRRYYDPYAGRSNFAVLANSQVTEILFDTTSSGLTATGVNYASGASSAPVTVQASREVIVAAGGVHSPQVLMVSGIGPSAVLEAAGVTVLNDLPGVGQNLQDHCMVHINYPYTNPSFNTPESFASNAAFNEASEAEYLSSKTGPWTSKPSTALAFLSLPQVSTNTADMVNAARYGGYYYPDTYDSTLQAGYQMQFASLIDRLGQDSVPAYECLNNNAGGLDVSLMHPLSRGTVQINSGSIFDSPSVDPRWCVNPFDLEVMIAAMQFNQQILNTDPIQQLEPSYDAGLTENASVDELTAFINKNLGTEFHYSGTCAMMPLELGGVIDANLMVYGTTNVRVVDSSTFPLIPAAHLQAVTYGVAEKAADIIKAAQ